LKNNKVNKICLSASGGGHLSQLLKLSASWHDYECVYITTTDIVRNKLIKLGKVYIAGECNRHHPVKVMKVFWQSLKIIYREQPDVLISTGAAVGCMACFLGKIFGAKVIWIDSITNVEQISLSGRMVRFIADLFLVQWPHLADQYKNVEYVGSVI
jgi:UDP-N-acetylglucosamine:LPS N-acetylglucosamine transferase